MSKEEECYIPYFLPLGIDRKSTPASGGWAGGWSVRAVLEGADELPFLGLSRFRLAVLCARLSFDWVHLDMNLDHPLVPVVLADACGIQ